MRIIFCEPLLTMKNLDSANAFYNECKKLLDAYVVNNLYVSSVFQINQLLTEQPDKNDILIFFNAENGIYDDSVIKLVKKYNDAQSRIWPIAMENTPECRRPPSSVSAKQRDRKSTRQNSSHL